MKELRYKMIFALTILLISVFIGLGLLLGQLFKTSYLNSFQEQMKQEGVLIAKQIADQGGVNTINRERIEHTQEVLKSRITIVDYAGNTLFDSDKYGGNYKNHNEQINSIIHGINKEQTGTKHIENGLNRFYFWSTIEINGKLDGIVILSSEANELMISYKQLWLLLFLILGGSFIVILIIGSKITTNFTKPVESATRTAIELAKGNYHARAHEDHYNEFSTLNISLNILARNLQSITKEQEMQKDRLRAVIENMGMPLILIDAKGRIILVNQMFNEMFHVVAQDIIGKTYLDVIEYERVNDIIENIFMTEQKIRKQITIPINIQMKDFEVYGAPIISLANEWKGIVLVFHDITEIKNLEKIRKDFVANVSHELKTPITSIKGFAETLLDGALHDQQALESFLNIILKESNRLQSLVYDLLELSKIESDNLRLNIKNVHICKVIQDIVDSLKKRAKEKSIEIQIDTNNRHQIIEGDLLRIQQIFINLISNALSYTLPDGEVHIDIRDEQDFVTISIRDTGIGIETEEIPRIFERFYRVDKARSRNSGGTGLGLAIVKHSVEAHNGEIRVESEVGRGSNFIVRLPKKFSADLNKSNSNSTR